jgi:hypothetical protein
MNSSYVNPDHLPTEMHVYVGLASRFVTKPWRLHGRAEWFGVGAVPGGGVRYLGCVCGLVLRALQPNCCDACIAPHISCCTPQLLLHLYAHMLHLRNLLHLEHTHKHGRGLHQQPHYASPAHQCVYGCELFGLRLPLPALVPVSRQTDPIWEQHRCTGTVDLWA